MQTDRLRTTLKGAHARHLLRMGPKKIAAVAALAGSTALLSLSTDDLGLVLVYGLLALGLLVIGYLVMDTRREVRRVLRSSQKRPAPADASAARTRERSSPIVAGVASIPERSEALGQAVTSMIDQVDHLYVFLNEYDEVPVFLTSDKITVYRSQDHSNLYDNGKFFGLRNHDSGVYFTIDDDLVYPPDYVERMLQALEQIDHAGVVGVHGVLYPENPLSFMNRRTAHYQYGNRELRPVSLLGTGTAAFPIELLDLPLEVFETPRMADVWLAKYLKERRIPIFALARSPGWLKDAQFETETPTIWAATQADHSGPTRVIVSERPWGVDDLIGRLTGPAFTEDRLPHRWREFVGFYRDLREHGPDVAVARLHDPASVGTYLLFYCEPPEVMATARAALSLDGRTSELFARAMPRAREHDPAEAGRLLERALRDAVADEDWDAAAHLAVESSKSYRHAGEFSRAEVVLDLTRGRGDTAALADERINLAIDLQDHVRARELFLATSHLLKRDASYSLRLALVAAHTDSVQAAAPWITDLFLDRVETVRQARLIRHLRRFHGAGQRLSGRFPFVLVEEAARREAVDPLPAIHLLLAIGDRDGARRLVVDCLPAIERERPGYAPLLWAATAGDLEEVVGHLNVRFEMGGLSPLSVAPASKGDLPLARVQATPVASDRDERISVIMSAHNCADTLGYALDSILRQSVRDLQVIVVDDGSTDDTATVLAGFVERDGRVLGVTMAENRGPYACRNAALDRADGDYIAIHDADDFAHPQRLEHQLALLADEERVACFTSHVRIADDGSIVPENHGELIGEGPMTFMFARRVFEDLGYFMPVRSRGDVEYRDRMLYYYGAHRLVNDAMPLLLARDAVTTNSRRFDAAPEHAGAVARFKAEARTRHQLAAGRRDRLRVAQPS